MTLFVVGNGAPNGAVQSAFSADGPLSGPQAAKDEDDDDKVFVELSRSFTMGQYTTGVEVAPRITTKDSTSSAAGLIRTNVGIATRVAPIIRRSPSRSDGEPHPSNA